MVDEKTNITDTGESSTTSGKTSNDNEKSSDKAEEILNDTVKETSKDNKGGAVDDIKKSANDTVKETSKDNKEGAADDIKKSTNDTVNETSKANKEGAVDDIKKSAHDTVKETSKDNKEGAADDIKKSTNDIVKETSKDNKEGVVDDIKKSSNDTVKVTFKDNVECIDDIEKSANDTKEVSNDIEKSTDAIEEVSNDIEKVNSKENTERSDEVAKSVNDIEKVTSKNNEEYSDDLPKSVHNIETVPPKDIGECSDDIRKSGNDIETVPPKDIGECYDEVVKCFSGIEKVTSNGPNPDDIGKSSNDNEGNVESSKDIGVTYKNNIRSDDCWIPSILSMERGLHDRDRVGVQDFVLLENYESEDAFIDNLKKRFNENLIYTYIGQVLVSVNPYKELPIYTEQHIREYARKHFFEVPPHIFAISENAYRSLMEENRGQCILISGESGSGKTEASKKVLQYIAAASNHQTNLEIVKDKLVQSNPVLEAFGNAKTNRNDNSSRFGKYMDVTFDFSGAPLGGDILNYLLEKSRVVNQTSGERNFHIFYQLLAGANDDLIRELKLERKYEKYNYLTDGAKSNVPSINDSGNFKAIKKAMTVIDFEEEEQNDIFSIIASVLHLGNICFTNSEGKAQISTSNQVANAAELLKCSKEELTAALTHRTIDARGDVVTSPLNQEMAYYARDALAKAIYDRLFSWLVERINKSLKAHDPKGKFSNVMGILDIYGFEIFQRNSFEQFCINFCNEKLQQLFIELTLRSEQEEYEREGIEWIPVEYFDNKVICNLIEEKHKGIISILDEECLRPGEPTDKTFLSKLNDCLGNHPHFISHQKASTAIQKTMSREDFRLVHYAGDVTYNSAGFLDKNNDLLFRDLKETMTNSTNKIINDCFGSKELNSKKRPETAITQFRSSLNNLMEILMCKEPSYIRCIKPNDLQSPGVFNDELVLHQVKYLGLMENLRVRRAGFAYRRTYDMFLQRYKCLSRETWPHYHGSTKDGVQILANALKYNTDDYRMGKTKIFIRFPKTLFETEDSFQAKKHDLATIIQSRWKGRQQRLWYQKFRANVIAVQTYCRRYLAIQELKRRREAVKKIREFIKGFITRNHPPNGLNDAFIANSKRMWLMRLSRSLPKTVLDRSWPVAPTHCEEASNLLHKLHRSHLSRVYRLALSKEKRKQMELKVLAEDIFKGKKKSYPPSIGPWFIDDRIPKENTTQVQNFVQANFGPESLKYGTTCVKFDRHGYKPRERIALLSEKALYLLDGKTYKQKHRLPLDKIDFNVTNHTDNLLLVRIPVELKKDKGDLILEIPNVIEFCIFAIDTVRNSKMINIVDTASLQHNLVTGKTGVIDIQTGTTPSITKAKSGHLLVTASQ